MDETQTTEELYRSLDPGEREEAVRLAARLQAGGEESVSLLSAAREAGVEDRFLREAAARVRSQPDQIARPSLLTAWPHLRWTERVGFVPVLALVLCTLSQLQAGVVAHYSAYGQEPWLAYLLAGVLPLLSPRAWAKWAPFAIVAGLWFVNLAVNHILTIGLAWSSPLHSSEALGLRFAAYALSTTGIGTLLAPRVARLGRELPAPETIATS